METIGVEGKHKASVVMQRLSYPTETVLFNKITRNIMFLSFKDSPRKPLGRRPTDKSGLVFQSRSTPSYFPPVWFGLTSSSRTTKLRIPAESFANKAGERVPEIGYRHRGKRIF